MGYLSLWRGLHGAAIMSQNLALDILKHLRYYDCARPVPGAKALHPWRGVRGRSRSPVERLGFFFAITLNVATGHNRAPCDLGRSHP